VVEGARPTRRGELRERHRHDEVSLNRAQGRLADGSHSS
jgi:hypothetical protein